MKRFLMILVALMATVTLGFTQAKPVVVVVPFDAKNVNQDDVDIISDVFLSAYTDTRKATVVDRGSFDKIKEQQKFQLSDWSDAGKVAELGKALNANQIITGQISQFGSQLVCTIKLLDVNTTEIVASTTKRVANFDLLFDECEKMAKDMAAKATMNARNYGIGDAGPAGGIIYRVDGNMRYEISEIVGKYTYDDAYNLYQINGTPYYDWELPSSAEMQQVYNNLVKNGLISTVDDGFRTTDYRSWGAGYLYEREGYLFSLGTGKKASLSIPDSRKENVRLIRKFNINDKSAQTPPSNPVGVYTAQVSIGEVIERYKSWEYYDMLCSGLNTNSKLNFTLYINDNGTFTVEFDYLFWENIYKRSKLQKLNTEIKKKSYSGRWAMRRVSTDDGKSKIIPLFWIKWANKWEWNERIILHTEYDKPYSSDPYTALSVSVDLNNMDVYVENIFMQDKRDYTSISSNGKTLKLIKKGE